MSLFPGVGIRMLKFNKDSWFIFILLAFVYGYFYQDAGWNGNTRIALSLAVVREGRLTIDTYHADQNAGLYTGDSSFYEGHFYTDKAIGSSIIGILAYLPIYFFERFLGVRPDMTVIKHLITFLGLALPSAFCGSLMYLVCEYISHSRIRAYVVTLAVALGTWIFPFSIVFFGHQLAGTALFLSFFLIFRLKINAATIRPVQVWGIGLALGCAVITEFPTAIVVFILVCYFFFVLWKIRQLKFSFAILFPVLGALIPLGIMALYNQTVFHHPLQTGYEYVTFQPFQKGMSQGLLGIGRPSLRVLFFQTFHPTVGLFWMSPVLLMTFVGAFFMVRSKVYIPELLLVSLAALGMLVMNSGYYMWWGGNSFAPRHVIPMLPFLCLPLIFVPRRLFPVVILLTLVSVVQMFFPTASDILAPDSNLENLKKLKIFEFSMLYSYELPHLLDGGFCWNLGQLVGLKNWPSLIPVAGVLVGSSFYMARKSKEPTTSQL
jgi:hypothetical protein